jgi:uncharacterized membrane protein
MPDNNTILLNKILHNTHIYSKAYLQSLNNIDLLFIWLTLSKPHKQPRQKFNKIAMEV